MALRAKPKDPYPTTSAVDRRLSEIATVLRSDNITDGYRDVLTREANALLDKRLTLELRELVG